MNLNLKCVAPHKQSNEQRAMHEMQNWAAEILKDYEKTKGCSMPNSQPRNNKEKF